MKVTAFLKILLLTPLLWATSPFASDEGEIPGSSKGDNYRLSDSDCMKYKGDYLINFTAYNPDVVWERDHDIHKKGSYRKLCQEIPALGKSYLSMDLNDALLDKPVRIRVINAASKEPLFEGVFQTYPDGTINAEVNFTTAGRYIAILEIDDKAGEKPQVIRLPLIVGPSKDSLILDVVVPLLLIGGLGFWMYRRDQKKKAAARF
jgi:hypothetical protein